MNCVILQPSYVPWRGFFHQIQKSDVFVFYDDVQYDKGGWRNRNRIKTANGSTWLTIPVNAPLGTPINEVKIDWRHGWARKHRAQLAQSYGKAPHFDQYVPMLDEFFGRQDELLSDFTIDFTIALARALGITKTQFVRSSTLGATGVKTDRLIQVLEKVGATHYISGPSARDYIETERFTNAGITLEYMTYDYPEYPQLHPPFDGAISILDTLFMLGDQAGTVIWGART